MESNILVYGICLLVNLVCGAVAYREYKRMYGGDGNFQYAAILFAVYVLLIIAVSAIVFNVLVNNAYDIILFIFRS